MVQQRGLADAGEADEHDGGVAVLLDAVAVVGPGSFGGLLLQHAFESGEPRLEYPEVPLSSLVDLGAAHLLLDQLDLLGYTHGVMRTAAHKKNVASKHLFLLRNESDIA